MKNLVEALKEPGRLVALAIVSWLLTEGLGYIVNAAGAKLSPEYQLIVIGILTSALKGLDAYLHEVGKTTGNESLTRGLTRF